VTGEIYFYYFVDIKRYKVTGEIYFYLQKSGNFLSKRKCLYLYTVSLNVRNVLWWKSVCQMR